MNNIYHGMSGDCQLNNHNICTGEFITSGTNCDCVCHNITFVIEYQLCNNGVWTEYTHQAHGKRELNQVMTAFIPQIAGLIMVVTRIYVK